ncbi:hypothetical protein ACQVBX_13485 [Dyella sp. KULCS107]|uniref:hypothetical protein n=1 Tax=Dyella sp. KULCS107 TaxID=3422216 RepID=UPI003D6EDF00
MKSCLAAFLVLSLTAGPLLAEGVGAWKPLKAIPGHTACEPGKIVISDRSVQLSLCVTQGSMAHDRYVLEIAGEEVLSGIDDETSRGLSGHYQGAPISMVCKPEHKAPADDDPMVASLAKGFMSHPGTSAEQAHKMAVLMLTTEIGRQCVVRQGEQILMTVPVCFD